MKMQREIDQVVDETLPLDTTANTIQETPLALPLDQIVTNINADSVIDAVEYVKGFFTPGGGE